MVKAIPLVNPTTIGYGMNLKIAPHTAQAHHHQDDTRHDSGDDKALDTVLGHNAGHYHDERPVGPPIRYLEPPNTDTRKTGHYGSNESLLRSHPLAIPNAMASGRAMIPTITPAARSDANADELYLPFLNRLKI